MSRTERPGVLEMDTGDHVALWMRGTHSVGIWRSEDFGAAPSARATWELTVPADAPFTGEYLGRLVRAAVGTRDDDNTPPWPERAELLAHSVRADRPYPGETGRRPALELLGAKVTIRLDDRGRLCIAVDTKDCPEALRGDDHAVPVTVAVDGIPHDLADSDL